VAQQALQQKKEEEKSGNYFSTSTQDELKDIIPSKADVLSSVASLQKVVIRHDEKKKKEIEKKLSKLNNDDDMIDLMPVYQHDTTYTTVENSDDEDDFSKMDMGKKNQLKRSDFDSEEAWNSYMQSREATPKAAFQFGVKTEHGRKTRKDQKNQKQKIDKDLKKIQDHIKKREAFKSAVPTAEELIKKAKY
jgi:hypothetical protein